MSSYSTPARVQFPRSNDTGVVPVALAPGSFAVNWADCKTYVGDGGGNPVLFSQKLMDWAAWRAFRIGDNVVRNGEIYRATIDMAPNTPFEIGPWEVITGSGRAKIAEPFASSSVGAGGLVASVPGQPLNVSVSAGAGVVVEVDGVNPVERSVQWDTTVITLPDTRAWMVVYADATGGIAAQGIAAMVGTERRNIIPLAYVLPNGTDLFIVGAELQVADTAETLRDLYFADGGNYRIGGLRLTVGAALSLDVSAGSIFALGRQRQTNPDAPNIVPFAARTGVSMGYVSRDRSRAARTTLDPAHWDSGATNLAAVPPSAATIQYVCMEPAGNIYVQYGGNVYASLSTALDSVEADWDALVKFTPGIPTILLGALVMRGDASQPADVVTLTAANRGDPFLSRVGGGGDQFMLIDGSRPMIGDLDMGGNAIDNSDIDGGTF